MMRFLRKHRTWLMIVISILAIPFVFYFVQKPDYGKMGGDDFAKIYDRKISIVEAQKLGRLYGLARALGMTGLIQDLTAAAREDNERAVEFIFNLLILRHEAERLGIQPSSTEIVDFVQSLQPFRGQNGFDMNKYTEFSQQMLSPNGFTEAQLEELARDQLCLNRMKELVAMSVSVPETEMKNRFDQAYGRMTADVIRLRTADFAKDVKITDEDIQKYYDGHKAEMKTDEKRKVDFVSLALNDEQKKLKGKEHIDALQKLADRATDFTQALSEKGADFRQTANKFQLPVQSTGEFTAANPDPKLGPEGQLGAAAFQLSEQDPNSEPIQVADGYYILHLAGISPSRPLTLEEAKPKIVDALKASRAREAVAAKGAQAAHDLREGLKAGEPLSFSAERVNVKAEKVEPFTLMEDAEAENPAKENADKNAPKDKKEPKQKRPPDFIAIKNAASSLQPGEVSDFFPWEGGGIIVVLEKRESPDEAKYRDKKNSLTERIQKDKREVAFYDWLREKQREAGILNETAEQNAPPPPKRS